MVMVMVGGRDGGKVVGTGEGAQAGAGAGGGAGGAAAARDFRCNSRSHLDEAPGH